MEMVDVDKIKELLQPSIVDVKNKLVKNYFNYCIVDKEIISHNLSLMICLLAGTNKVEEIEEELNKTLENIEEMVKEESNIGYVEGVIVGVLNYKIGMIVDNLGRE